MGRFEKQPDNPRVRGEISRAAENALWGVVEDLENLQQHVLRSLQEDIKRLQGEKNRLSDEIQRLVDEKEQLQQVRQITEQQVLIRQLAEALAKHISSQLQSSLTALGNQTIERTSSERAALKSEESNSTIATVNNQKIEQLLGALDNTLTITFKSLQQEINNYQSNIYQQLSVMQSQQQQGEIILTELINRLQGLEKTVEESALKVVTVSPAIVSQPSEQLAIKASPPTVLQLSEPQQNGYFERSPQLVEVASKPAEPISVLSPLSESEITPAVVENQPAEPISVLSPLSETQITPAVVENQPAEPISVLSPLSETQITPAPVEKKPAEPISLRSGELSQRKTRTEPTANNRRQKTTPTAPTRTSSTKLSAIQIGFLLVVLSTVLSSLYNVAIKVLFQEGSQLLGVTVYGLLVPTLGNTLFILMLRLLVVVPLMLLLAPMMHQNVWQDLQTLFESARSKPTAADGKTQKVVQLAIASGCCLFLSQVLVYIAISQITTGAAIALFFIYPMISGLLSWLLLGDRPSLFRAGAMGALFCGELLVLGGASSSSTGDVSFGSSAAIFSGVAFAAYVILTRLCANKVHPVSLTLIHFTTMLLLSFICLIIPLPSDWSLNIDISKVLEIILSAFMLGVLTLCGYVLNNLGIRQLGASKAAIIGASVPILTVIFAGLIIQDSLEILQIFGVLLVTFSAAAFGFETMQNQIKSSSSTN